MGEVRKIALSCYAMAQTGQICEFFFVVGIACNGMLGALVQ